MRNFFYVSIYVFIYVEVHSKFYEYRKNKQLTICDGTSIRARSACLYSISKIRKYIKESKIHHQQLRGHVVNKTSTVHVIKKIMHMARTMLQVAVTTFNFVSGLNKEASHANFPYHSSTSFIVDFML